MPQTDFPNAQKDLPGFGRTLPRLETLVTGDYTDGHLVAEFSSMHLGFDLLPWQLHVVEQAFRCNVAGSNDYSVRQVLCSTARQSGKSSLEAAVIGTWLTSIARQRGKPQTVLSTAHDLISGMSNVREGRADTCRAFRCESEMGLWPHGAANARWLKMVCACRHASSRSWPQCGSDLLG